MSYEPGTGDNQHFTVSGQPVSMKSQNQFPSVVFPANTPFSASVDLSFSGDWAQQICNLGLPLKLDGYAASLSGGPGSAIGSASVTTGGGATGYTLTINCPGLPADAYMVTVRLSSTALPIFGFDQIAIDVT